MMHREPFDFPAPLRRYNPLTAVTVYDPAKFLLNFLAESILELSTVGLAGVVGTGVPVVDNPAALRVSR